MNQTGVWDAGRPLAASRNGTETGSDIGIDAIGALLQRALRRCFEGRTNVTRSMGVVEEPSG